MKQKETLQQLRSNTCTLTVTGNRNEPEPIENNRATTSTSTPRTKTLSDAARLRRNELRRKRYAAERSALRQLAISNPNIIATTATPRTVTPSYAARLRRNELRRKRYAATRGAIRQLAISNQKLSSNIIENSPSTSNHNLNLNSPIEPEPNENNRATTSTPRTETPSDAARLPQHDLSSHRYALRREGQLAANNQQINQPFAFDSQFENRFAYSGESSSQSRTTAEHLNASTAVQPFSKEETDNTSFTEGRIKVEFPSPTQTPKDHVENERQEIYSELKDPLQNISYIPKQKKTIPVVDEEMINFVKSYGMAISKGLEALPADVAIEFSSKVLKELNEKVLEVEFKQNRKSDNESVYSWRSVSNENEKPDDLGTELDAVIQGEIPVEKPNEGTALQESTREESNIVSFTAETVRMAAPVSIQTFRGHDTNESQKISSKLKEPPENQPSTVQDNNMIPSADDDIKNFVKSYGLAISRGLETLPGDVTIGVALNILKELNEKVLEVKFKHSSRSGSDYCDTGMDDGDQEEVLPKDKEKINVFLDMPIKIEPEFSFDNDCNF